MSNVNNSVKLSIIIVSFNNLSDINTCLKSIEKYNDLGKKLEVIVVDNSPSMEIYDCLAANYKNIKLIKNENNGFGAGNNRGSEIASGEYLLFLNPDTELIEPIFRTIIEHFDINSDLIMCGVKLLSIDRKTTFSFHFLDRYNLISNQLIKICNYLNIFLPSKMFIMGANIFIRNDSFNKVGKFDENIYMYHEESDLTHRVMQIFPDKKIAFFRKLHIIHKGGKRSTSWQQYSKLLSINSDSESYYCRKYGFDYLKRVDKRLKYEKLKLFYYKILKKNNVIEFQKNVVNYFVTEQYKLEGINK